ncbi:MAG: DUF302 domain-containing protein [Rhodobacteraceae bacterium]|nr:DUF302 domain-containing protein [Paracoccaceae bacterium]
MKLHLAPLLAVMLATPAMADKAITYIVQEDIEDVLFSLESEIIGRGLKIDNVSHVGAMLDRTAMDVGASEKIFFRAQVFSFCSATISREVMQVNPANLAYCPYTIFAYTTPDAMDTTIVGHDDYPDNEMQAVEDLLSGIVRDALALD